jgi:hypothetical protein
MLRLAFVPAVHPDGTLPARTRSAPTRQCWPNRWEDTTSLRAEQGGSESAEPPPGMVAAVALVRMEFARASRPWFSASPDGRNTAGEQLQAPAFVKIGNRDTGGHREPIPTGDQVDLRS